VTQVMRFIGSRTTQMHVSALRREGDTARRGLRSRT